ncbi:MAG TPA: ribosome-associated translation inhibitor RaiA [Candidatus Pacearchaeota archaeon]|nr:ribosome-associated translation inhibitor RaiA [Candidatus Pacearchaeota archaeon]
MKIKIKETEIKINKGVVSFLEKKIKKLEKFFPSQAEVIVEAELGLAGRHHQKGDVCRAEIQISMPGKKLWRAVSTKDNLKSAIIEAVEDLETQLRKRKESFITQRKKV